MASATTGEVLDVASGVTETNAMLIRASVEYDDAAAALHRARQDRTSDEQLVTSVAGCDFPQNIKDQAQQGLDASNTRVNAAQDRFAAAEGRLAAVRALAAAMRGHHDLAAQAAALGGLAHPSAYGQASSAGQPASKPRQEGSTVPPTNPTPNRPGSPVADVLGYADGDTCHGTDQVTSAAGAATTLALMDYGDGDDRWTGGRYVAVATSPRRWNPITNAELGGRDKKLGEYGAPNLDRVEAEAAARHLEELAALAESGYRPPRPTKWSRAAQRLQNLVDADADLAREKVMIGDDELPVSVRDLLALLRDKEPNKGAATRRKVSTKAIDHAGGDVGTVWLDLVDHRDGPRIMVAAVEGTESPDDDYWQPYTAHHTPAQARELAGKLRAFAAEVVNEPPS
ncbi:hypothetical protein JNW90_01170 [Micromonospora sp. STR1s_5]|nr:hypothetical protein [Micromonospora sp. STR1s_5]